MYMHAMNKMMIMMTLHIISTLPIMKPYQEHHMTQIPLLVMSKRIQVHHQI